MQRAMIMCNEVPTEVLTLGRWVEEGLAPDGKKDVIVIIPGNPGIPAFYEEFLKTLKSKLPPETPVWILGYAGFVQPASELFTMPNNKRLYDLRGQLDHKAEFIKKYVPKDARLHLVGHSIGSWFILNLLRDEEIANRVIKCYLLFPTIEHMADSPNGRFLINVVLRVAAFLVFLAWIFSLFPSFLRNFLVTIFGLFYGYPRKSTPAILQLLEPQVLRKVFALAKQEMAVVTELDNEMVTQNKKKLWFYYGTKDGWVPVSYYQNMRVKFPDVDIQLCKRNLYHSFVLKHSIEMGQILGNVINENIS